MRKEKWNPAESERPRNCLRRKWGPFFHFATCWSKVSLQEGSVTFTMCHSWPFNSFTSRWRHLYWAMNPYLFTSFKEFPTWHQRSLMKSKHYENFLEHRHQDAKFQPNWMFSPVKRKFFWNQQKTRWRKQIRVLSALCRDNGRAI